MNTKDDYRGKCFSTHGKRTKTGDLKRSGNFSRQTFKSQHLQVKDYQVRYHTYESGVKILIVGDHTPLAQLMGEAVATLAMNDSHFESYRQVGKQIIGEREYEKRATLRKSETGSKLSYCRYDFVLRIEIQTEGELKFNFPEY